MEFTQEQKLYAEIVQKAWEDPQFKSELMTSPVEAIEKATGQKLNLPQNKTLVVRDQTDESTIYINLPARSNTDDVELNEEQLEVVAGGTTLSCFPIGPIIDILIPPLTTFPIEPIRY
jgi:hypothetical protein